MAYDNLETDHHLTPRGWVDGDSRFFGKTDVSREIPKDRVLTLTHKTYQQSAYSREERSVRTTWRHPSIGASEIATLCTNSSRLFQRKTNSRDHAPVRPSSGVGELLDRRSADSG